MPAAVTFCRATWSANMSERSSLARGRCSRSKECVVKVRRKSYVGERPRHRPGLAAAMSYTCVEAIMPAVSPTRRSGSTWYSAGVSPLRVAERYSYGGERPRHRPGLAAAMSYTCVEAIMPAVSPTRRSGSTWYSAGVSPLRVAERYSYGGERPRHRPGLAAAMSYTCVEAIMPAVSPTRRSGSTWYSAGVSPLRVAERYSYVGERPRHRPGLAAAMSYTCVEAIMPAVSPTRRSGSTWYSAGVSPLRVAERYSYVGERPRHRPGLAAAMSYTCVEAIMPAVSPTRRSGSTWYSAGVSPLRVAERYSYVGERPRHRPGLAAAMSYTCVEAIMPAVSPTRRSGSTWYSAGVSPLRVAERYSYVGERPRHRPGLAAAMSYTCVEAIMPAVSPTRRSGSTWYSAGVSPLRVAERYSYVGERPRHRPGLAAAMSYTCVEAIMPAVSPTRRSGSTWYSAGVSPLRVAERYSYVGERPRHRPGLAAAMSYTCVEAIMPAVSPTRRSGSTWYSAGVSPLRVAERYSYVGERPRHRPGLAAAMSYTCVEAIMPAVSPTRRSGSTWYSAGVSPLRVAERYSYVGERPRHRPGLAAAMSYTCVEAIMPAVSPTRRSGSTCGRGTDLGWRRRCRTRAWRPSCRP
ncbi:hypothetical protein ACJJTC_001218 [Scirpophaga incertulas]